jgi:hypothetical protein
MTERPALVIDRVIDEMKRVDWKKYSNKRPGLLPYVGWARRALADLREEISKHETWDELGPDPQEPDMTPEWVRGEEGKR